MSPALHVAKHRQEPYTGPLYGGKCEDLGQGGHNKPVYLSIVATIVHAHSIWRYHLLELLVFGLETKLINFICDTHLLNLFLETLHLLLGRSDDVVYSVDVGGIYSTSYKINL